MDNGIFDDPQRVSSFISGKALVYLKEAHAEEGGAARPILEEGLLLRQVLGPDSVGLLCRIDAIAHANGRSCREQLSAWLEAECDRIRALGEKG